MRPSEKKYSKGCNEMKLDRFLALLFSKRMIALLLLLVLAVSCLTACEQTIEDIFWLYFCGCLSPETCKDLVWACDCDSTACRDDGTTCRQGNCVGESYNSCFGCVWEGCLEDCRPSTICNSCEGEADE